jgi:hypothetical protein
MTGAKNKILGCAMGLTGAAVSVYGSRLGFAAEWDATNKAAIIAWVLALLAHAAQMTLVTKGRLNWSLVLSGLAAYVYSIYTNALFIRDLGATDWTLPLAVGIILDVLPEPLLARSCGTGDSTDAFSNLRDFFREEFEGKKKARAR